jgi:heme oxygenase (biliverdin-IX-beta and delta-forming)
MVKAAWICDTTLEWMRSASSGSPARRAMQADPTFRPVSRCDSLHIATEDLQHDLDRSASGFELSDRRHYRGYLQASASALLAVEQLLEQAGVDQLLTDWPSRSRSAAILADLQSLDIQAEPFALRRAPPTQAEMFGILYVLEESRLEARALLPRVLGSDDAAVRDTSAYLRASEPALWQSFVRELETHIAADDQTQTVAGAVYAFMIFIRSFRRVRAELRRLG